MLKKRLISGILIAGGFVYIVLYANSLVAWALIILISTLAQMEFYSIINMAGIPVFRGVGTFCGAALITATYFCIGPDFENIARAYKWEQAILTASLIAIFIRQFPQKHNSRPLATIGCTLLGIWYVPFLFNFITRLAFFWDGRDSGGNIGVTGVMLVIYLVAVVKITDVAAFFTGKFFGRHKLFPRISPGKTWEGLAGGLTGGVLVSVCFALLFHNRIGNLHFSYINSLVCGFILSVTGVLGDMFESLLKRAAGIKDSGSVVPGMGGFLDVLDSLLFAAPVLYTFALFFLSPAFIS